MKLIYPGSFDPITTGHVDIAKRGAKLAAKLIIAVLDNPHKKTLFSVEERISLLKTTFAEEKNIEIDSFSGLLADYVKHQNADAVLRGLRSPADLESETRYAACNNLLSGGVDTIFLSASPGFSHISSSIVREIAVYGTNFISMVTPAVQDALIKKFHCGGNK